MFFRSGGGGIQWLVVFLGNPGKEYENTRHNVGFITADIIEKQEKVKISRLKFNALTGTAVFGESKTLLMKPQTYMNLSGKAVSQAAAFYKVPPERVLVVCDDTALPLGTLRIRTKGSSGGHNGLKSIISALGTEEFPRIKIGVGSPEPGSGENPMVDWVLGKPRGKDAEITGDACKRAARAVGVFIQEGADRAMNTFN